MDQLCIFEQPIKEGVSSWKLYIDGASRNNPGPAGAGVVIIKDGSMVQQEGFYLGRKTNNQAEYLALLLGIFLVPQLMRSDEQLVIISDSELLVRQLRGAYKVKNVELKKLFSIAKELLKGVSCQVQHVLREKNKDADKMANKGIEAKDAVPEAFKQLLKTYQVEWH